MAFSDLARSAFPPVVSDGKDGRRLRFVVRIQLSSVPFRVQKKGQATRMKRGRDQALNGESPSPRDEEILRRMGGSNSQYSGWQWQRHFGQTQPWAHEKKSRNPCTKLRYASCKHAKYFHHPTIPLPSKFGHFLFNLSKPDASRTRRTAQIDRRPTLAESEVCVDQTQKQPRQNLVYRWLSITQVLLCLSKDCVSRPISSIGQKSKLLMQE